MFLSWGEATYRKIFWWPRQSWWKWNYPQMTSKSPFCLHLPIRFPFQSAAGFPPASCHRRNFPCLRLLLVRICGNHSDIYRFRWFQPLEQAPRLRHFWHGQPETYAYDEKPSGRLRLTIFLYVNLRLSSRKHVCIM